MRFLAWSGFLCFASSLCHASNDSINLPSAPLTNEAVSGVGFDLSLEYGLVKRPSLSSFLTCSSRTAAVHFPNGTGKPVAKVEGSPAYRSLISRYTEATHNITVPDPDIPAYLSVLSQFMKRSQSAAIHQAASHRFASVVGAPFPILGSTFERFVQAQTRCFQPSSEYEDIKAFSQMLLSLQKSTEAYLDREVHEAAISVPVYPYGQQAKNIDCAMAINGLKIPATYYTSSVGATEANRAGIADDGKPQIVLAVDHSRTHLTVELLANEDNLYESLRDECNTAPGTDRRGSPEHWRDIQALIQRVAGAPYPKCFLELPDEISRLVLFGDQTEDLAFRDVLRTSSREGGTWMPTESETMADPIFAAALGMAKLHSKFGRHAVPY